MKAHEIIQDAAYGPETLKVLCQAFDEAWEKVAPHFGNDPRAIEAARLELASIVLSLAGPDSRDAEQIKRSALDIMPLP
jgi:hypothetical protein